MTKVKCAVGPGLLDPCEKENVDVAAQLEAQRREDITSSAQHALRLIAFNQMYKILAVDRIKMGGQVRFQNNVWRKFIRVQMSRKRPAPELQPGVPAALRPAKEQTVEPGEVRGTPAPN